MTVRCRLGSRPIAPCWDDLCHSGSETLCGIPEEWLYADEDGEEPDDDEWAEEQADALAWWRGQQ